MKTADIKKMTKTEKLEALEALWDSLIKDDAITESPDWHIEILNKRKKQADEGKSKFTSLDDLKRKH